MNLLAAAELSGKLDMPYVVAYLYCGGPGSGRHPGNGVQYNEANRKAVVDFLTSRGFVSMHTQGDIDVTKRPEVFSHNAGNLVKEQEENGITQHAVMVAPDGSWWHTSTGHHAGNTAEDLKRIGLHGV